MCLNPQRIKRLLISAYNVKKRQYFYLHEYRLCNTLRSRLKGNFDQFSFVFVNGGIEKNSAQGIPQPIYI